MSDVNTTQHTAVALVAIDIAKRNHDVAILLPNGKTATMKLANSKDGFSAPNEGRSTLWRPRTRSV
jgi:hypothetical protein